MSFPEFRPNDLAREAEALLAKKYKEVPEDEFTISIQKSRMQGVAQYLDTATKLEKPVIGSAEDPINIRDRLGELIGKFSKVIKSTPLDPAKKVDITLNVTDREILRTLYGNNDSRLKRFRDANGNKLKQSVELLTGAQIGVVRQIRRKRW